MREGILKKRGRAGAYRIKTRDEKARKRGGSKNQNTQEIEKRVGKLLRTQEDRRGDVEILKKGTKDSIDVKTSIRRGKKKNARITGWLNWEEKDAKVPERARGARMGERGGS